MPDSPFTHTHRYWDQYYPGGTYDPNSRRKGAPTSTGPLAKGGLSTSAPDTRKASVAPAPGFKKAAPRVPLSGAATAAGKADVSEYVNAIASLNQQNLEIKAAAGQIEKEREFYFGKLRAIEVLVQQYFDQESEAADSASYLKEIQSVLYQVRGVLAGFPFGPPFLGPSCPLSTCSAPPPPRAHDRRRRGLNCPMLPCNLGHG
jgi:hypothetical protein